MTTHRRVWRMAGPIILSNVSVPLLGAVDTAVVGHLPDPYYIGAVGIGAMIFNFIYFGFNCLRMGTTGPTAQASGAEDWAEVRGILGRALLLAGSIAGVLLMLQVAIADFAFFMVEASGEVEELGRRYFMIRVWAAPGALATYVIIGWFYGLENARIPLILQIAANGINIVLDVLFVFGFGWGVEGVAIASVIAEFSGLALGLYFVRRQLKRIAGAGSHTALLDLVKLRRLIFFNGYIFFRTLCVVTGMAVFMAQGAKLGDVTLAANQVLFNFLQFTAFGLDGFAHAAEALIGDAIGRRNREAFSRAVRSVLL
ncbi:MAG: MATE family efflux transporter [Alphaproteobacteria bacterium]|nr:MATE family efflux transporter [Alphaproteobacteria bacterium]